MNAHKDELSGGKLAHKGPPKQAGAADQQTDGLLRLLQLEADIRRVATDKELIFHSVNESRGVLGFRQAFVLRRRARWRLAAVSSTNAFDRNAPLTVGVQELAGQFEKEADLQGPRVVNLASVEAPAALRDNPFPHALWLPLLTRGRLQFAGLLLLRETPWPDAVIPLAQRVAETYAHAWEGLAGQSLGRRWRMPRRILAPVLGLCLLAAGFVQAPLTVLAPAEVTGRDRANVSAALTGVIEDVLVTPNTPVTAGTVLARFDDTELRNALAIADQETVVARAQLEKLQNASFSDRSAARELKVAEAELALAAAESKLARDRVSRVEIRAPRDGLVVIDDVQALVGKPVAIGERLMEIVNPQELEFTVRLPVDDSIVLEQGARVRVFLDSNPLAPVEATLTRRGYRASAQEDGAFAFRMTASVPADAMGSTRLGAQGTAQLFGDRHSLFFIAFRRPISWVRQTFGF